MTDSISRPLMGVALLVLLAGCGKGAADYKEAAQAALDRGDYPAAVEQADQAMAATDDRALVWQAEQIKLQALAKAGQGDEAAALLERLAGEYEAQVSSSMYISVADALKHADQTAAAISVLDAGNKRFPDHSETFTAAIDDLQKTEDLSPDELELLKTLGYLGG